MVWESVKNRGSISDNVLDETVSNSAILALDRRHIGSRCKDGRACRAPKRRDREPLHLEAGPVEEASSVFLFQPPGRQKRPMIFCGQRDGPRRKKLRKFFGSGQLRFPGLSTAYPLYPNPYGEAS